MMKPAANQAFGSKSSFWQQMKKNTPKVIFGRRPYFWRPKKKLAANHFLQETQVSSYIWQQITETPSDMIQLQNTQHLVIVHLLQCETKLK